MATRRRIVQGESYRFDDLKTLLSVASPKRSGDELGGISASSDQHRIAARMALADLPLQTFVDEEIIPSESDEVSRLIAERQDPVAFRPISNQTVGEFRDWLLSDEATPQAISGLKMGLTPEMVSAVSKLMRNQDLIAVSRKIEVQTAFRSTLGLPNRLASRLQPNHPTDDLVGIAVATLDGLLYGMGDAVIGVNPATDNVGSTIALLQMLDELRERYQIPTQTCVLSHVTTTLEAIAAGAPVDLVFQSVAGTELANDGFGVSLSVLREAHDAVRSLNRGTVGTNAMYFETGQGSALSANAHHGVDQQTCEVRAYAVAREFDPLLVNTVVGFIGPEYLADSKQIIRAGLEDHFCGKLLGLPMGVDVCYTNHADADQDDMDSLMFLLAAAGVNFLIAVPGADDVMLGYQSLSHHDVSSLRKAMNLRPAPEFEAWLDRMEIENRSSLSNNAAKLLALGGTLVA
jgi:ethanolamine ammonia-lyase large subunit